MSLEHAMRSLLQEGASASEATAALEIKDPETDKRAGSPEIHKHSTGGREYAITDPKEWDDEKLKNFYVEIRRLSHDARAYKQTIRDEVWDLYNGLMDFSQKADWQSKLVRPKVFMMVEQVVAFIQLGLFKMRDWFDVIPQNITDPLAMQKAHLKKSILKWYTTQDDFIRELCTALKWGFLSELFIMKVFTEEEEIYTIEPNFLEDQNKVSWQENDQDLPPIRQEILTEKKIVCNAVNPHYVFLDHTGKKKFIIEEGRMAIADYKALVDDEIFEDHFDEIVNDTQQTMRDVREKRKQELITQPPSTYYKEFTYGEYWGDIFDESGKFAFRNAHFIIAVGKWIIKKTEPITFFDGEPPYVIAPCVSVPGSVYHKSLIEPIAEEAKTMSELINLAMDALFATVLNVFEIDVDRVLNVDDITNGIGPNTVIQKTGSDPVLTVQQVGKVPGEAFQGIQFLGDIMEQDTGISRSMVGFPTTTKRQTKTEVQQEQGQMSTFFQAVMQNIERDFLAPVLEKIWNRILQYPSFLLHPELKDIIGQEAASIFERMSPRERYEAIHGRDQIKVTGLSGLMAKKDLLGNILGFLRIVGRSPDMMAWIDPQKLLFEVLDLLNIEPTTILRNQPQQPLNTRQQNPAQAQSAMQPRQQTRPGMTGQPAVPTVGNAPPPNGRGGQAQMAQMLQMLMAQRGGAA
jgi:hypothetical protein